MNKLIMILVGILTLGTVGCEQSFIKIDRRPKPVFPIFRDMEQVQIPVSTGSANSQEESQAETCKIRGYIFSSENCAPCEKQSVEVRKLADRGWRCTSLMESHYRTLYADDGAEGSRLAFKFGVTSTPTTVLADLNDTVLAKASRVLTEGELSEAFRQVNEGVKNSPLSGPATFDSVFATRRNNQEQEQFGGRRRRGRF